MARRTKTLAEQLAELDDPTPKDFDPEEEPPQDDSDEDVDAEDNTAAARDHYVDVGKSKLRKRDVVPLGPRYEGSRVSRDALTGDDDEEDDPFSKGFDEEESEVDAAEEDEGAEEDFSDEDGEGLEDGEESPATDVSDEEEEDDDEDEEEEEAEDGEDRAELRKMMADEQKSVAASLSQAAKQDAEKGRAVKTQRSTFDSLLNTRIKLQKALIGANTLTGVIQDTNTADDDSDSNTEDAFRAAETAAFTLWSSLNSLRETLESNRTGHKRKRPSFSIDTATEDLVSHMRAQDSSSLPHHNSILEKWSAKARGATALTPRNRLNNTSTTQTIIDVLQEQLHSDRLLKRARTPRSCAPLQLSLSSSAPIYDDADFYGILLQTLLEQRSADSIAATASNAIDISSLPSRRDAKAKKNIDTKASKGRKLRYTVHEKLQDFMAPEDRGTWGDRQMDELFGGLFGRRIGLGEDEEGEEEEAGLLLFRN